MSDITNTISNKISQFRIKDILFRSVSGNDLQLAFNIIVWLKDLEKHYWKDFEINNNTEEEICRLQETVENYKRTIKSLQEDLSCNKK